MITKWIISGILLFIIPHTFGQISLTGKGQGDNLLPPPDIASSKYQISQLAEEFLNMMECLQELKQYDSALLEIRLGLTPAQEDSLQHIKTAGSKELSKAFDKIDQFDSVLIYLQSYLKLRDSLWPGKDNVSLEELYVAYETQKAHSEAAARQKEIDLLKQDKRLNFLSNYFIISLLMLALVISTFFFIRNRMKRKLAESELRNEKLESIQIRRELEGKQKDLTNLALEIARKNELFIKTNEALAQIQKADLSTDQQKQIQKLIQFNAQQLRINDDLEELQINIEQVNADFFEKLAKIASDLTPAEKQLCALLRLNLGTKEIASIRNISPKSVEMARYRLRKKLPLIGEHDIYGFIQGI